MKRTFYGWLLSNFDTQNRKLTLVFNPRFTRCYGAYGFAMNYNIAKQVDLKSIRKCEEYKSDKYRSFIVAFCINKCILAEESTIGSDIHLHSVNTTILETNTNLFSLDPSVPFKSLCQSLCFSLLLIQRCSNLLHFSNSDIQILFVVVNAN